MFTEPGFKAESNPWLPAVLLMEAIPEGAMDKEEALTVRALGRGAN
jgi:hypothetical protein